MFFTDFEWSDIILSHYLFSVFVSLIAVVVTCIITKKYNRQFNSDQKTHSAIRTESSILQSNVSHTKVPTSVMKKSPALAAEKVIKANMTKEQQLLEYQVRQKQLAQIHELMMKQSDKFGNISLSDVEEQMKLYQ